MNQRSADVFLVLPERPLRCFDQALPPDSRAPQGLLAALPPTNGENRSRCQPRRGKRAFSATGGARRKAANWSLARKLASHPSGCAASGSSLSLQPRKKKSDRSPKIPASLPIPSSTDAGSRRARRRAFGLCRPPPLPDLAGHLPVRRVLGRPSLQGRGPPQAQAAGDAHGQEARARLLVQAPP